MIIILRKTLLVAISASPCVVSLQKHLTQNSFSITSLYKVKEFWVSRFRHVSELAFNGHGRLSKLNERDAPQPPAIHRYTPMALAKCWCFVWCTKSDARPCPAAHREKLHGVRAGVLLRPEEYRRPEVRQRRANRAQAAVLRPHHHCPEKIPKKGC